MCWRDVRACVEGLVFSVPGKGKLEHVVGRMVGLGVIMLVACLLYLLGHCIGLAVVFPGSLAR